MPTSTNASPRRTQAERRGEAVDALLDAAGVLFARHGVVETSLAQIGELAGYSRGLPNHHFGSKAALIEELLRRCQERFVESVRPPAAETSARDAIVAIADRYVEVLAHPTPEIRAFFVLWGVAFPQNGPVTTIPAADRRSREIVEELVRRGHADGSISPTVNPSAFAVVLLGLIRGIGAQLLTDPAAIDVRAVCEQTRRLVDGYLAPGRN